MGQADSPGRSGAAGSSDAYANQHNGEEVMLKWGEAQNTQKTSIEPHRQVEIRVKVAPTPYAQDARENYADSWRTKK